MADRKRYNNALKGVSSGATKAKSGSTDHLKDMRGPTIRAHLKSATTRRTASVNSAR